MTYDDCGAKQAATEFDLCIIINSASCVWISRHTRTCVINTRAQPCLRWHCSVIMTCKDSFLKKLLFLYHACVQVFPHLLPWSATATSTSHLLPLSSVTILQSAWVVLAVGTPAHGLDQIQWSEWAHPDDTNHHGVSTAGFDSRITDVARQTNALVLFCFFFFFSSIRWATWPTPWSWSSCSRRCFGAEWCWLRPPTGLRTVRPHNYLKVPFLSSEKAQV